jgi:hypothetical protein
MTSTRDQRAISRIQPFIVRCRVVTAERPLTAYITDLSPRGARLTLKGSSSLAVGLPVELHARLARATTPCRLKAEVKWVHPPDAKGWVAVGVRFVSVTLEERRVLERVVEEFRGHASRLAQS